MKIYVRDKGITLVGKAWEVKHALKTYKKKYKTIHEWIQTQKK